MIYKQTTLLLILICSVFSQSFSQTVDITYPEVISGSPGQTILFPITVSDVPISTNALSLTFIFTFENDHIEDINLITDGSIVPYTLFGNRNFNQSDYRVGGFGTSPISGSGLLFTLEIILGETTPINGSLFTIERAHLNGIDTPPFFNPEAPLNIPLSIFGVDFSLPIQILDAGSGLGSLVIGTAPDATTGFDSQYDVLAPPPPPAGAFDARIVTSENDFIEFYQPTNSSQTIWDLSFQSGNENYPITINWDSNLLPESGSFIMQDVIDGSFVTVDMRLENSVSISESFISSVRIEYEVLSQTYEAGWSLVGLPVETDFNNVQEVFGTVTPNSLYRFEGSYIPETEVEPGIGYWLNRPEGDTVIFEGSPILSKTIQVNEGWNIISGISVTSIILDPQNIIQTDTLFGFDGAYQQVNELEPGRGYWVFANSAGLIELVDASD